MIRLEFRLRYCAGCTGYVKPLAGLFLQDLTLPFVDMAVDRKTAPAMINPIMLQVRAAPMTAARNVSQLSER